ncbi:energy transducer TonB [Granulicella tundricola]|uniref:TonB family protein n=1 Tax=Granulicella tundricola (strain ATCC BAA-1859 / DSM 23138 / MP5ACTX9) TaxID=1198114 RepID=E8X0D8_GRATM|nr:energy transducer TonB [Granulicella tundricola]ADW67802.1 TonB family protein [Granulicella tundricola MP5ACTX9]
MGLTLPFICRIAALTLLLPGFAVLRASAQTVPPLASASTASDPRLAAAELLIGRALFLRGFYGASELSYDASGHVQGAPPRMDWTLTGFDLQAVTQPKADVLLLNGIRVAIRYNPDAHTFDRHPLKGEAVHIQIAEAETVQALKTTLAAIFSTGIDPALQRSTPEFWRHYFEPSLAWSKDAASPDSLLDTPVLGVGGKLPPNVSAPVPDSQPRPDYTSAARQDRVQGTVVLRVVVGVDGSPHRITIVRPLGYGLDAKAAEALSHWHFRPGMQDGKSVAVEMTVNQEFSLATPMK